MTVFVDTFALIAWLNPRDSAHFAVSAYLDTFHGRMVTTEWILLELADAFSSANARSTVIDFLQSVRADPHVDVVGYVESVYQTGFDSFSHRPDKDWSLTDCISFGVMAERGLIEALTADRHFEQAGFRAIFKF
jgi:uncharacterized protein